MELSLTKQTSLEKNKNAKLKLQLRALCTHTGVLGYSGRLELITGWREYVLSRQKWTVQSGACQSNVVCRGSHGAEKQSDSTCVGVPWLCRWFMPSGAGERRGFNVMWSRHIDISRQFSNESNAALEGELLSIGEINVTRRSFGISMGVQMQHLSFSLRPQVFTPDPAFTSNHSIWLRCAPVTEHWARILSLHHIVTTYKQRKHCFEYKPRKITP